MPSGTDLSTELYVGDRDHKLMILEDLGECGPLMGLLQGDVEEETIEAFERFGALLGQLHAATFGGERKLNEIKANLGLTSLPLDNASRDIRTDLPNLKGHFGKLGVETSNGFVEELE